MKVSVWLITYNHEKYIAQAIESVLMQRTLFDFEIVIGEDCSTDNTRSICMEYQKKYPDSIKLIFSKKNVGPQLNASRVFNACQGRYIALLEGDDYWTDPYKLQKQVEFLENHPDFSITAHYTLNIFESGTPEKQVVVLTGENCPQIFTLRTALFGTPVHTSSWTIRNTFKQDDFLSNTFLKFPTGDDPLLLYVLKHGNGYCFQEFMGCYRINNNSFWSPKPSWEKLFIMLSFYLNIHLIVGDLFKKEIKSKIIDARSDLAKQLVEANNKAQYLKFKRNLRKGKISLADKIKLWGLFTMARFLSTFGLNLIWLDRFNRVMNA